MSELVTRLRRRLFIILPLLALATVCFMQASQAGPGLGALPWVIFGIAAIFLCALAIAFPVAEFLAIPFGRIYFPHVEGTPKPNYPLAEWYLDQDRPDDAYREYDKILRYHPRELVARCLHIELLLANFEDEQAAERSFKRGMRLAKDPKIREQLAKTYAEALRRTVLA